LKQRILFLVWLVCLAVPSTTAVGSAQCTDTAIQQAQKQAIVADPQYSQQIRLARQAALEIYEREMVTNSDSVPKSKVYRPPGVSIAVAVDGKLVWAEGFGFADLEQCVPTTPKTKFRIGSTSKPLTSAGAMLLYQQGRLDLDSPIQRYVPSIPDKGYDITTRELLGHLGGIRGYTPADGNDENRDVYPSVTESLRRFKDDPLIAPPRTKWKYSAYGYVLVSAAIEGASGQDFLSFMRDKVFLPLGMQDTVADENDKIISNRARWYNLRSDGSYRNSLYADLSYKWAAGGFLSTVEDLVRFGSALLKPGFLKQDTLALIFTPQKTSTGEKTRVKYGLGWGIHDPGDPDPIVDNGNVRRFEHGGGAVGSSSNLIIYPDQQLVIAWLQNSDDFRDWPMFKVAAPFFVDQKGVQPKPKMR
jgi:CubicO group peptidase (beta-lactamase class C family)